MKKIAVLFLIPLLLCLIWFRDGLVTGGGEEGILFYNPAKVLRLSTSVWIEDATGGTTIGWLPKAPIIYIASIFQKTGLPPFVLQALLFYLLLTTGVLSMYYLVLNLLGQIKSGRFIALTAAGFYLFNPYTMSQIWGRGIYAQYFAFALLPLALLIYVLGIKKRNLLYGVLLALVSAVLAGSYGFFTFIVVFWTVILGWLVFRLISKKEGILFSIMFTVFTFAVWGLFNSWWLIPLFSSAGNVYSAGLAGEDNIGTLLGVSGHFTPDLIVRLLQKTYFFSEHSYGKIYSSLFFQLISLIPPVFVIWGFIKLIKNKDLKEFKFFLILLILGLLVSSGANPPLGWLFVWLFKKISFLQAFRNPFEKFGIVYMLGYSAVFAFGLHVFLDRFKLSGKTIILGSVIIFFGVIYLWPMWTGRILSGPDRKIGIDVPFYYRELNQQLINLNTDNYRVFMTPLMSGDGAVYQWNSRIYNGADPMEFILDPAAISRSLKAPYYYEFTQNLRKYMSRMNVVPAFSLLRAKYLVGRQDAILISESEKEHEKYLTKSIDVPLGIDKSRGPVCENIKSAAVSVNPAWITCRIPEGQTDWSKVKYLHVSFKTDVPSTVEVAVRDDKEARPRWDGRADSDYSTPTSSQTTLTIPLGAPTEYNNRIDFSDIRLFELLAHPLGFPQASSGEIDLKGVWLDEGKEEEISEFKLINRLGKLNLYEPVNFNPVPEFGLISSLDAVKDFPELFQQVQKKRNLLNSTGFFLTDQNQQKEFKILSESFEVSVLDKLKKNGTRYWLKTEKNKEAYIVLSKTFNPQWKLIKNIKKDEIEGGFISDLNLLGKEFIPEDRHFVVNGYANLWATNAEDGEFAIIYMPQVIADIAAKISVFSLLIISGIGIILIIKKRLT